MIEWIFTVLAWALLVLGLGLLGWALLWDRSRGRRRCPKCWYGIEGVPQAEGGGWTCPECGRAIEKERRLLRTRRRWGYVAIALVLLAGSYASYTGPAVRSRGWWAAVPDVVLIALLPHLDAFDRPGPQGGTNNAARTEVVFRSDAMMHGSAPGTSPAWVEGGLWPWERWLLGRRARVLLANAQREGEAQWAVWLCVIASDRIDAGLPEEHLVTALVARSTLAYQRATAYMDYGVHVSLPGVGPHPYELFVTAMQRPGGRVRYEGRDRHPFVRSDWKRLVVWRDDGGVLKSWWTVRENQGVTTPPRLGLALAGTHHDVTGALLPAEHWGSPLTRSKVSEYVGEAELLGHRVLELRGQNRHGGTDTLWIDADTFVVRRARNFFGDTWFVPSINAAAAALLDASWWAFDPAEQGGTPLERFDDKLQDLLARIDMPTDSEREEATRQRLEMRSRLSPSGGTP